MTRSEYPLHGPTWRLSAGRSWSKAAADRTESPNLLCVAGRSEAQWRHIAASPLRRWALRLGLLFLFFRLSGLHEFLTDTLHVRVSLSAFSMPLLVLICVTGAVGRALRWAPARFLVTFAVFFGMASMVSFWPGQSLGLFVIYLRSDLLPLFVLGGLVVTEREYDAVLRTFALASIASILLGLVWSGEGTRLELRAGSFDDPNDYAAHLLMLLPLSALTVLDSARAWWLRLLAACLVPCGLVLIARTGSRGAGFAAVVVIVWCLVVMRIKARITLVLAVVVCGVVITVFVGERTINRLVSLVDNSKESSSEFESRYQRLYLFHESLRLTAQHPFLGIGPGQFANVEGTEARERGAHGAWHTSHNAYTQVTSETGLPAGVGFVGCVGSTVLLLRRIRRRSRVGTRWRLIAMCSSAAMIGFCSAIAFLSLAYSFHLPTMAGFAIASALRLELALAFPEGFQDDGRVVGEGIVGVRLGGRL
jgi:O-antigen ligase